MILENFIIYDYNDTVSFLLKASAVGGFNTERSKFLIDIIGSYLHHMVISNLSVGLSLNVLMLVYFISLLIFGFIFFKKILDSRVQGFIFSLLYSSSIYFIFRVSSLTFNLYPIFLFPLVTYFLIKKIKPYTLGAILFLMFAYTSYYGFFSYILTIFWYFCNVLIDKNSFNEKFRKFLVNSISVTAVLLILLTIFFRPLLLNSKLYTPNNRDGGNSGSSEVITTVSRPIEDWYNFSFRPWYFVIPPESSIFFGDLSDKWLKAIENTDYYLADDYAAEEMAGAYMGWHFLLGMGFVGYLLLAEKFKGIKYDKFKSVYKNRKLIIRSFLIIFLILLISGPPSFTISGIEIYTPSYLLYYVAPVFRVLTRWAVVIYLFVLVINSFLVQDLYDLMKNKLQKSLFIIGFISLNFVIFAIELPIINLNNPPHEIAYFDQVTDDQVKYAVYPSADYYSIFWILVHENYLVNPRDYKDPVTNFSSEEFSENLVTKDGLSKFEDMGGEYLIYYENRVSDNNVEKITEELNPDINTHQDLRQFFDLNFGDTVYDEDGVVIYVNISSE